MTARNSIFLVGFETSRLSERKLPTKRQILSFFFYKHKSLNLTIRQSATDVANDIIKIWSEFNLPTIKLFYVVGKIERLFREWKNLLKSRKNKKTIAKKNKEREFTKKLDKLFNISKKTSEQLLTDEQRALLNEDTRLRRSTAKSALSDTPISDLELPSTSRSISFHSSPEQELERSISSFSNDLKRFASDVEDPYPENHKKPKKIDVINPAVVSALDRTNTSSRNAVYLFAAFSESLGVPVEDTNLSYSTIRRRRLEARKDIVDDLKDKIQFPNNLFLHWDTKFLVDVCGYEKVDRLAVVVSGSNFEQLLNIPKIGSGTGEQQTLSIIDSLDDWGIADKIKGLCFDTTASNTGAEDDVHHFTGNDTHIDYFRLVLRDGDSLLVGGRNLVYNLSMTDMNEQQRLTWFSNEHDAKMCVMKGKDEENCQNYIRIMAKSAAGRLLLCGTNAFKPVCREYNILNGNYTMEKEKSGQAVCPYDPHHNSTAIYVDGDLYTGTVADFSGMDPIIYRETLQTEQYDSMSLNAPDFVGSMTQGDFVYFFFRETAVEYINCGKAVYSRVARVCKNDRGGPHRFRNRWTSFLKSRLNCSVTGEFPFYFNEIQSATELMEGQYGDVSAQLIYGTFTTPPNSISGSAVCAFSLQDITDTFEGNFKEQSEINSNWLPVQSSKVPDPRPGQCHNDSRTLPDLTLNFIKTHSLMDESVPSFFGQPIVIRTILHYRFTQIAVDPQVKVPGGKTYDVLFIGTDNGKIIKAVNALSADTRHGVRPVVIEEIQVFPVHVPVRGIKVVRNGRQEGRLIVVSDGEVQSLRLHRCDSNKISSCSECVALQDPYCAWDKVQGKCRSHGSGRWGEETYFFQSIATGQHTACPSPKLSNKDAGSVGGLSSSQPKFNQDHQPSKDQPDGQVINIMQEKTFESNDPAVSAADTLPAQYSVETLIMAVVAGAVSALVVGFIAGYLCGRKCHKDEDDNLPYPDTEYEYFEQRQNMNRIQAEPKLLPQEEVTYAEPVLVPQPPPKLHSPKNTLRKGPHQNNAETLFQFQTDTGYNSRDTYRGRDNFGTLRSHQGDNYRRGDGFATTRSVKKVYL